MSMMLRKLLARVYRDEESGAGESSGGAPAGGSESSSSDESVDWAALNDGVDPGADDSEDDKAGTPVGEAAAAPPPSGAPAEKGATPVEDQGKVPGEKPEDGNPDPNAPPPDPEPDPEPQETPEQRAAREQQAKADFDQWRASEVERLTKEYAFDDETAQRLQTEPELVLPQLAAEMELRITQRALEAFQKMIPQVVPQVVVSQQTEKAATDFFYDKNPDLRKYHKQVLKAGKLYRELNPKASPEEAAEQIGNLVRTSLKLKPVGAQAPAPSPAPAAKPAPHKPAGAGSSGKAPAPAKSADDVWGKLIEDDDD
jgi:hypothetical protein